MPAVTVEVKGPLFDGRGKRIIDAVMHDTIQTVVERGVERLNEQARPRPGGVFLSVQEAQRGKASTGNYRRNISGDTQGLRGRIDDGNVIYGPWLEGTGSRNAKSRFKGYAMFRRTEQWLQKQVPGILRTTAARLVKRLG
jgi:hypothetical protein